LFSEASGAEAYRRDMLKSTLRMSVLAALFAAGLTSVALASPGVGVSTNPQAGNILVDDRGMTLYRFTPDSPNASTCYDACATDWPPVLVDSVPATADPALAGNLGIAPRRDGSQQLTYQGSPLYSFADDAQPGDANGQAAGGVWFVVTP
jgi:predicted lipoprotein with Yx(FWY)xxD motif